MAKYINPSIDFRRFAVAVQKTLLVQICNRAGEPFGLC